MTSVICAVRRIMGAAAGVVGRLFNCTADASGDRADIIRLEEMSRPAPCASQVPLPGRLLKLAALWQGGRGQPPGASEFDWHARFAAGAG